MRDMTSTGSLTLQGLSLDQTGVYTCELSDAEEKLVTNTFLQLTEGTISSKLRSQAVFKHWESTEHLQHKVEQTESFRTTCIHLFRNSFTLV